VLAVDDLWVTGPRQAQARETHGMKVILVRHAMPMTSASRPPSMWPLSPVGRAASAALSGRLPDRAVWLSSPERKAVETLALASSSHGPATVRDERFREVSRPGEPFDDEAPARRRAWVEGRLDERHDGWETPEQAAKRFQAAVLDHASRQPLVIATHGMVLAAWLVSIKHVQPGRPAGELWSRLAFPDIVEVFLPEAPTTP
jgi:broad specificity phosphatase PhoE